MVNVNGQIFRGTQVCKNKKNAHQEVAMIALDFMKSNPEWGEETAETTSSISSSSTASSSKVFYLAFCFQ